MPRVRISLPVRLLAFTLPNVQDEDEDFRNLREQFLQCLFYYRVRLLENENNWTIIRARNNLRLITDTFVSVCPEYEEYILENLFKYGLQSEDPQLVLMALELGFDPNNWVNNVQRYRVRSNQISIRSMVAIAKDKMKAEIPRMRRNELYKILKLMDKKLN